jgi:PPOX class probable F420-dependent enzyme
MAKLNDAVRQHLEGTYYWHLATLNPDGSPQVSPVWVHTRGDRILVNTAIGRKKDRNIRRDPRVALSVTDDQNQYESFMVQGRVVETIEGDQAERDIDSLAKKYLDKDVYPFRTETERRVTFLIEPEHVSPQG